MKKKIFSKLLMGAFLFASIGSFVSCKDYDDDINANRADIRAAQEQLTALSSNLSALQTKLENEKASLQQELATAKSQLETQIANAKAELNTAIAAKADQATVDALAVRVANLETDLAATKRAYDAKIEAINNSLTSLQTVIAAKADQTYVDQLVATLQAAINGKVSTEDFNTFKGDVAKLEVNLSNLATLVGTKADQTAVDAAVAAINKDIDQLKKDLEGKVSQSTFDDLKKSVEAIEKALANTDLDGMKKDLETLKGQIGNLVTTEQLQKAIDDLTALIATKADHSDFDKLNAQVQNIQGVLDTRDENITKQLTDAINDLRIELNSVIADNQAKTAEEIEKINGDIADILVTLAAVNGDIDNIFDWIDIAKDSLKILDGAISNNAIAIAALQLQGNAIAAFLGDFEQPNTLAKALDELKGKMSQEVKDSIANQNKYRAEAIAQIGRDIANLKSELLEKIGDNAEDIQDLQEKFEKINDIIDERISVYVTNLTAFISKSLKSISLVPQLFVGGIEAIEFRSLQYYPIKVGTSGLAQRQYTGDNYKESQYVSRAESARILIDNGTAEAYYRLNPSIVDRSSIDESNIDFLAATAVTRAATVPSPVKFNGIAENGWNYGGQKGLIKVNLKKTVTHSLNNPPSGNIYIVALKVPRKADEKLGTEAADIVSENSRLVENIMIPKIARLPWNVNETMRFKNPDNNTIGTVKVHHLTDSVTMYKQDVDDNQLVYATVNYNETYDVLAHVTGCDVSNTHVQITKDQLKTYGLTFRFHIPTREYKMDVDHATDQQQFASIDPITGVVSSRIPNNWTDNRACVGKEPIICIQLVDTVNNKYVDERYMKIKWVEKTKEPKYLGEFKKTSVLKPCEDNIAPGITWMEFITQVYAVIGDNGISQNTFKQVYYTNPMPTFSNVTMKWPNGNNASHLSLLSAAITPGKPTVYPTGNLQGDALIANWTLSPAEIANIYPQQSKTFKCTITFHSILPTEYPDLTLDYIWTITLPTLPDINGYYDNYWFQKYSLHDVMPVQYNSALYDQIAAGTVIPHGGTLETYANSNGRYYPWVDYKGNDAGYCVYYNNLMNAFTYEQKANVPQFIVKNLGKDCGTWDMQFTWPGPDFIDNGWIGEQKQGRAGGYKYPQFIYNGSDQYRPSSATNSPALNKGILWENAGAYRLENAATKQALQLVWDEGHVEWCGNINHKAAILYADHNNYANQRLINPLSQDNEDDGRTPKRTHDKKVHMGVWGTLNDWNIVHVKDYDICLVEPIRINAKLDGAFEEGYVSGTCVSCDDAFTMNDFRGYEVAKTDVTSGVTEWNKFRSQLYKYYEVGDPQWNLNDVRYGMTWTGSNVIANDNVTYANALTSAKIRQYTNDNIVLSVERKQYPAGSGKWYLVFKNNGGSNVEEEVNVFIPVTVSYGFGSITEYVKVRLYPKGKVASGVTIVAFPG